LDSGDYRLAISILFPERSMNRRRDFNVSSMVAKTLKFPLPLAGEGGPVRVRERE
jgi:hypothetical protein